MTDKEKELERLHDIVFEGAPEWAKCVAMDRIGRWCNFDSSPKKGNRCWVGADWSNCENQPETFLDWTETLIRRKQ